MKHMKRRQRGVNLPLPITKLVSKALLSNACLMSFNHFTEIDVIHKTHSSSHFIENKE